MVRTSTMINRITSVNNPNFFFMQYNKTDLVVENFIAVPKHFFSADIIEKRKPLGDNKMDPIEWTVKK